MKLFFLLTLILVSTAAFANPFIFKHDQSNHHLKVEILKGRGLHFEKMRNPLDVRVIPHRTSRTTAISAGQAIRFCKNLLVSLEKLCV